MGALCPLPQAAGRSHEERGTGTRCAAPENSWGEPPPRPRSLPPCPARCPARSSPYLPAPRLPGRPASGRVARKAGWQAGGRRGYPAPDMAHPTRAPLPPGRRMKEEEAAEGAGAQGALEGDPGEPSVPAALRHAGTVLPRRSLAPHGPPSSRRAEGPVLLRAPRFLRSPHPPSGTTGAAAPPTPPSPAGGRDPGSACPAPDRLQRDPWRLGGPLAPRELPTAQPPPPDTDPRRPLKSEARSRPALELTHMWLACQGEGP
ncbi:uncharacterized protein [Muntiacus reevesi]|uniref:uncharacterized protein n=1 Tax=Muntiacus reevesi TaxID=9886 RepID=UPI0033074CEA